MESWSIFPQSVCLLEWAGVEMLFGRIPLERRPFTKGASLNHFKASCPPKCFIKSLDFVPTRGRGGRCLLFLNDAMF